MRKRPIYLVALSAAIGLLAWGTVSGQGVGKPKSKAEIDAWQKGHPEEASKGTPTLNNKATNPSSQAGSQPMVAESPKAKHAPEAEVKKGFESEGNKPETNSAKTVSAPHSTLKDSEIPAHYKQAADYQDPAVRARLEDDLKSGKPQPRAEKAEAVVSKTSAQQAVTVQQINAEKNDSPVYRDTGNPSADMDSYMRAKAEWVKVQEENARQSDPEYRAMQEKIRQHQATEAREQRARDQEAAEEAAAIAKKQLENQSTEK